MAVPAALLGYYAVRGEDADWVAVAVATAASALVTLLAAEVFRRFGTVHWRRTKAKDDLQEEDEEDSRWSAVTALVTATVVTAGILAVTVALLILLSKQAVGGPEEALALVFVAAAVVLILVVCTLTIVLKRLGLVNRDEAMGLPRGSIRAVLALLLVLLFFIAAIFLFNTTRPLPPDPLELRQLNSVTAERLASIPSELIYEQDAVVRGGETVYDLTLLPSSADNRTSDDLAKQLITILGTLVTAVAAFYFGANSVSGAIKGHLETTRARSGGRNRRRRARRSPIRPPAQV